MADHRKEDNELVTKSPLHRPPLEDNEESEIFRTIFDTFDRNGDGVMCLEEIECVLQKLNADHIPSTRLTRLIEQFDADKSGTIDFDEFLSLLETVFSDKSDSVREAFRVLDMRCEDEVNRKDFVKRLRELNVGISKGEIQEPTEPSKQPIRARYLGHVTGYQPIRDQYLLIRSVPGEAEAIFTELDKDEKGTVTFEEFQEFVEECVVMLNCLFQVH
eukprot:sb/3469962/